MCDSGAVRTSSRQHGASHLCRLLGLPGLQTLVAAPLTEPAQKAGHKCAWHEGLVAFLWPRQEGRSLQGPMSTRCSPAEHSTASIPPKAMSGPARRALGTDWGKSSGYGGRGCCFGGLLHPVPGSHPTPAASQEARPIWGRLPPPSPWRCRGLPHSPRYTSCSQGRSQSGTARSWSSAAPGAGAVLASRG